MAVNGVAAANTLYSYSGIKVGMCLYYVWQAYKANGASTGMQAGTAYEGWQKSQGKHPGDRNPPAGVPVWFGPKASSSAGDVVISMGGGKVVATDWPSAGHTGICTIDQRQAQIGRPYLGWSERIFDVAIDYSGGSSSSAAVKNQQAWLISRGYDLGSSGADGIPGPYYYNAVKGYQQFLRAYGYTGDIDGLWGDQTQVAHAKFYAEVTAAAAPKFPPFPLGANQYFGPEAGGNDSISGYHSHNGDLKIWQQRMKDRGWTITVDGYYGPVGATTPQGETADVAGAFQAEKGLVVDKFIGRQTWDAAWIAPVTPPGGEVKPPVVEPPIVKPPVVEPPAEQWPTAGTNQSTRPTVDIQKFLISKGFLAAGDDDGHYGPTTSKGAAKFQSSEFIDIDGAWGRTSDGLAFKPAGSIHGVDYSFSRPNPATLKGRGVQLVGRYLWPAKYNSKGVTTAELEGLNANGIKTFFIYEQDGKELAGGLDAGIAVATKAEAELKILGLERYPIYFNVDYDPSDADIPKILDALRGIASVIGLERTGLYGGLKAIKAAFDAKVIRWGFQTYAWSGGQWDTRAQLQQWSNGQWGGSVDFTRAVKAEYGQNPVPVPPVVVTPPIVIPPVVEPPIVVPPQPETVVISKEFYDLIVELPTAFRKLADDIDEYLV